MSGGGSYGSPSGPQPFGPGQNQSFNPIPNPYSSGSSAPPYSAFGPTKSAGGSGFDPSQMGMTGGNMAYGGIDPNSGMGNVSPYAAFGTPQNFDSSGGMSGGNMSPYPSFDPYGGMSGGNMSPYGGYPPFDMSQISQFLQSPYMGAQMQQPQQPQQPAVPYYQSGQQQPMQPQAPQAPSADQTFLNGFNRSYGTRYDALSQLPANDYQNYLKTSGQG